MNYVLSESTQVFRWPGYFSSCVSAKKLCMQVWIHSFVNEIMVTAVFCEFMPIIADVARFYAQVLIFITVILVHPFLKGIPSIMVNAHENQ